MLKSTGSIFINLGDTYMSSGGASRHLGYSDSKYKNGRNGRFIEPQANKHLIIKPKSLVQIPSRFAIEMCNRGWILRNEITWKKDNIMPCSVTDRFTNDSEKIFFFVKNQKYYFEQQFEKTVDGLGLKNMRSTWSVNTKPFKESHFASYPEKLIEPIILSSVPEFICNKCGKPREKIFDKSEKIESQWSDRINNPQAFRDGRDMPQKVIKGINPKEIGYTNCGCDTEFKHGIVLDPFMGSGTTGVVAKKNKRDYVGIELNPEYIKMANDRIDKIIITPKLF